MENTKNVVTKEMVINGAMEFIAKVEKFRFELVGDKLNNMAKEMGKRGYYDMSLSIGRKYIRVVCDSLNSNSAYCFINTENGDILKTNSWKSPSTKTSPRGNVLSKENGMESIDKGGYIVSMRRGW